MSETRIWLVRHGKGRSFWDTYEEARQQQHSAERVGEETELIELAPAARIDSLERELQDAKAQFRAETLRTSEYAVMIDKMIARLCVEHEPGAWSRSCESCALVLEARALRMKPININPLAEMQAQLAERTRERDRYHDALIDRHGGEPIALLHELDGEREMRESAERQVRALQDRLFMRGEMALAPCFVCGYNGPNYYQPDAHPCAARHHAALAQQEGGE